MPVTSEQRFDEAALARYLATQGIPGPIEVRQFRGGQRSGDPGQAGSKIDEAGGSASELAARVGAGGPQDGQRQIVGAGSQREAGDRGLWRAHRNSREVAHGREEESANAHGATAPDDAPGAARERVGDHSAEEAAYRAGDQRKRRIETGLH